MIELVEYMGLKRYSLVLASLLIIALFLAVAPVSATTVHILNPGDSIQQNITAAASGDIIILNPGTYQQNNIVITTNITIEANQSLGGSSINTIINATSSNHRIFNNLGGYALNIDGLTLNGGGPTPIAVGGAIYSTGDLTITSSNITGCLETATGSVGGAIYSTGNVTVSSSVITNCSVKNFGGAIYSTGNVTVTSSTISGCNATGILSAGGAIFSKNYNTTITSSTIAGCNANFGGAIYSGDTATITIVSSTITGCSAFDGGAIWSRDGGIVTLTSSTINGCSAENFGGAIASSGTVTLQTSSVITGCSAVSGGAIYSTGSVSVISSIITDCTAEGGLAAAGVSVEPEIGGGGGAIYSWGGAITITNSTFTSCTAENFGGAVYYSLGDTESSTPVDIPFGNAVISSSTFTNCNSVNGEGGAIAAQYLMMNSTSITNCGVGTEGVGGAVITSGGSIGFSRLINDNTSTSTAVVVVGVGQPNPTGTPWTPSSFTAQAFTSGIPIGLIATDNWWGTNSNVSGFVSSGVTYNPWLVLGISASPTSIAAGGSSAVQANLIYDSNGDNTYSPGNAVPDGIPVSFAVISGPGGVNPSQASTSAGLAGTTFTSFQSGTEGVQATVDSQSVSVPITVTGKARSSNTCYWCSGSGASGSGAGYTGSSGTGSGSTGTSTTPSGGSPTQMPTVGQPTQMPTQQPTVNQPALASTSIPPLPTNTPKSGIDAIPVMGAIGLCGVIVLFRKNRD